MNGEQLPLTSPPATTTTQLVMAPEGRRPSSESTNMIHREVRTLWSSLRNNERDQEDIARETVRIRERLHGLVRAHEEMFDQEKDTRRMLRFQFKELHKLVSQSFEKIMALASEIHHTKVEVKEALEANRAMETQSIQELRASLEVERVKSSQLERDLQLTRSDLADVKTKLETYQLGVDLRIRQAIDLSFHTLRERMDFLQSAMAMQDGNLRQLQVSFRDSIFNTQQIEESHHQNLEISFRSRVEPLTEKLEHTSQSMRKNIRELEDKSVVMEGELTKCKLELAKQIEVGQQSVHAKLEELQRQLSQAASTQVKQQNQSEMVTMDLVSAVASMKDTLQLLSKDQARARRDLEGEFYRRILEVRKDVHLEVENRIKKAQRDNVFIL